MSLIFVNILITLKSILISNGLLLYFLLPKSTKNHPGLAEEKKPPKGINRIKWVLFTTLPINKIDDAFKYIKWYSYRWVIERYHYTLKSGCKIEELQLEKGSRIKRALAINSIIAWHILWMTYESRNNPKTSFDFILEQNEWKVLYKIYNKEKKVPKKPPPIKQAVRWIAKLGGFIGRKSDGDPGVKSIWRGYTKLKEIVSYGIMIKNYKIDFID